MRIIRLAHPRRFVPSAEPTRPPRPYRLKRNFVVGSRCHRRSTTKFAPCSRPGIPGEHMVHAVDWHEP